MGHGMPSPPGEAVEPLRQGVRVKDISPLLFTG